MTPSSNKLIKRPRLQTAKYEIFKMYPWLALNPCCLCELPVTIFSSGSDMFVRLMSRVTLLLFKENI